MAARGKADAKGKKNTGGRPPFEFFKSDKEGERDDYRELRKLAEIHCTQEEAAGWFKVTKKTFMAAINRDPEAQEIWETGRDGGKASLRRLQWESAEKGNSTMLVWLGKQLLGQKDIPTPGADDAGTLAQSLRSMAKGIEESTVGAA